MSNINSQATVNLTVNGQQPLQVLQQLKQRAMELENAIAKAAAAGNKIELRKLRRELGDTRRQMREIETSTMQVERVLLRLDKATPKELNKTLQTLNRQLEYMERGSAAWNAHVEKIKRVKAELAKVSAEMRSQESLWERFNRKLNDWQTSLMGMAALLTGLVMAGRKAVNSYAEMEEEIANTIKYTGMARNEVDAMNDAFRHMDTRTGRDKLNELAQEAGRLGKNTRESVQGYVEAADIINVALVDLGEGATQTIAKLTNIFGVEQILGTKDAMLAVGSTVNVLSQNCTAAKPYLVQFAQRMAGVGAQARMTIPEILAFAATLDANGQKVEMSASAMSRLIMMLFQKPQEIAKTVGLDVEKFTETLNRSTNEGVLMFLGKLQEIGEADALAALSPLFKDLGMDGIRMAQVLATLATHLDMVKWEQEEANKAFTEAKSATREYNIFNNTAQAGIDKARKAIQELAIQLGEKLLPLYKHIMTSGSAMLRFLNVIVDFVIKYKSALITLTASWVAHTIAVNASNVAFKAHYYWIVLTEGAQRILTTTTLALKVAFYAVTGQINKAKAAYTAFHLLTKSTPWGLIIAAVTALGVGIYQLAKKTDAATRAQKALNEIQTEAKKKAAEQMQQVNLLMAAANNLNLTFAEQKTAVDKLNKVIPGFNGRINAQTRALTYSEQALKNYNDQLVRLYELEGAKEKLKELGKQKADLVIKRNEQQQAINAENERQRRQNVRMSGNPNYSTSSGGSAPAVSNISISNTATLRGMKGKLDDINEDIKDVDSQMNAINEAYGNDLQRQEVKKPVNPESDITDGGGYGGGGIADTGGGGGGSHGTEDRFKAEKEWREREEALNRIAYATGQKNYEQYTDRMNEILIEFYKRQLAHTDLSENERLGIQAQYAEEMKKSQELNLKKRVTEEKTAFDELKAETQQDYLDGKLSKQAYDMQMENIELAHLRALVEIQKEGSEERLLAEANYRQRLIQEQERRRKETEEAEKKHQAELKKIKDEFFGNNVAENLEQYNTAMSALEEVYQAEVRAAGDNAKEKLRIDEAYEKAKLALKKKYNQLGSEEDMNAMQKWNQDILEWLNGDGGQAVTKSVETLTSSMSSIFSQLSSLVQSEMEIETAAIEKRYEREVSMAEGNKYKTKQLEKQKQKEIAKVKDDANRKMFAMQVIQAVAQTATAALNAYSSAAAIPVVGYILGPIAAAMAIAAGAIQIATIKKQQQASTAQGYAQGGFTKQGAVGEVAGVVHAGEWVASQRLLASPVARPLIEALDYAQRTNTIGSLRQSDVSRTITAPAVLAQSQAPTVIVQENKELRETLARLNQRLNDPFVTVNTVTGDMGIKQAQDDYQRLMNNKSPKNKRK